MPLIIIILAAGKGTRMCSDLPKVMHNIAGRPMLSWVLERAEQLDPAQIIVVTAPGMDDVAKLASSHTIAVQQEQKGTADAVKAAIPYMKHDEGNVLILLGDEPLLPLSALQEMVNEDQPTAMALRTESPKGLGRMIEGNERKLLRIVEEKDASKAEKDINLCNAGNYCLNYDLLLKWLPEIDNDNVQHEYYLTDLAEIARKDDLPFKIVEVEVGHVWGVNNRVQLAEHEAHVQAELRLNAMANGVTMIDPGSVFLSWDTEFGKDVVIEPNVFFGPGVKIGDHVTICAFTHLETAHVSAKCRIGPFARLRPGSELDEGVRIGNFVEVKNAQLGKGVKANHLGYIGDAIVGADTNFGCGAITVNYDGFEKHQTKIGFNVMVGSNANLVAPVTIEDNAFIAAGSTITHDVPRGALALSRPETEIEDGWVMKYRERKKLIKAKREG